MAAEKFVTLIKTRPVLFVGVFLASFWVVFVLGIALDVFFNPADSRDARDASMGLSTEQQIAILPIAIQRQLAKTERYVFSSDLASLDSHEFAKRIEAARRLGIEAAILSDRLRQLTQSLPADQGDITELDASISIIADNVAKYFDNMTRRVALIDINMGKGLLADENGTTIDGVSVAESASAYLISLRKLTDERTVVLESIKTASADIEHWYKTLCDRQADCAPLGNSDAAG